mmetsp:Transcript_44498/g.141668  ORF Transcript_44498/g.141668 Transcript_44498/m.141668 type:complete len:210 (-) Transcript_44498:1309-1938(-)
MRRVVVGARHEADRRAECVARRIEAHQMLASRTGVQQRCRREPRLCHALEQPVQAREEPGEHPALDGHRGPPGRDAALRREAQQRIVKGHATVPMRPNRQDTAGRDAKPTLDITTAEGLMLFLHGVQPQHQMHHLVSEGLRSLPHRRGALIKTILAVAAAALAQFASDGLRGPRFLRGRLRSLAIAIRHRALRRLALRRSLRQWRRQRA